MIGMETIQMEDEEEPRGLDFADTDSQVTGQEAAQCTLQKDKAGT